MRWAVVRRWRGFVISPPPSLTFLVKYEAKISHIFSLLADCRCVGVYRWVSLMRRPHLPSLKVTCQHFLSHFPRRQEAIVSCANTSHTDPRLITRSDKSNQQPPSPRTGRITEVTSAFQGVSLPQETARDMSQRFLSEHTHSPFKTVCDSEKSLPRPRLGTVHTQGYNLQATALLAGTAIRLHPKGGEVFLSPLLFFWRLLVR